MLVALSSARSLCSKRYLTRGHRRLSYHPACGGLPMEEMGSVSRRLRLSGAPAPVAYALVGARPLRDEG